MKTLQRIEQETKAEAERTLRASFTPFTGEDAESFAARVNAHVPPRVIAEEASKRFNAAVQAENANLRAATDALTVRNAEARRTVDTQTAARVAEAQRTAEAKRAQADVIATAERDGTPIARSQTAADIYAEMRYEYVDATGAVPVLVKPR